MSTYWDYHCLDHHSDAEIEWANRLSDVLVEVWGARSKLVAAADSDDIVIEARAARTYSVLPVDWIVEHADCRVVVRCEYPTVDDISLS